MKISVIEPLGISREDLNNRIITKIGDSHNIKYFRDRREGNEELINRCRDAEIIVVSNIKIGKEVLKECKDLKMICVAFTGIDHIDKEYCDENNIEIKNCAGYSTAAVADIVFAFIINLARNIISCDKVVKKSGTKNGLVGFELEGKTIGVIGLGQIGTRVCHIAKAFGMEVIAYSRTPKEIEGVKIVSFEHLLKKADIVTVHVPQTEKTINLIDEPELKLMKKSAILINTARGPIVNEMALRRALDSNIIAGAGVDVFNTEPPLEENHILFGAKNTILTPHIAFASQQSFEKRGDIVANNLKDFINK